MQIIRHILIGFVLGIVVTVSINYAIAEQSGKGAYLVVAGKVIDPEGLEAYREKAGPVAVEAGIEIFARNNEVTPAHVLEGTWPYEGSLTLERFDSMQALRDFWFSESYQEAIKLREGKVHLDFVVAVPGI